MIEFNVYPGGKTRIVTFSYDDGAPTDERLVPLFNKYGVKATFHLNGKNYLDTAPEDFLKLRELYKGHEIASHTVWHGSPEYMPAQSVVKETYEDRMILEKISDYPVVGMSYPNGSFDPPSETAMKACGIVYSRTTRSTKGFAIPRDFMEWHPTCHHRDALPLCEKFLADIDSVWVNPLFYIWGHSHELRTEEDWQYMEKIVSMLAHNDKVWYATNKEIYEYVMAQKQLQYTTDEKVFYNPTAIDIWFEKDNNGFFCVPAGQTVHL